MIEQDLRDRLLAEPELLLEDRDVMAALIAAPAYAGVPVTHRGVSTSVTIVTGHEDPDKGRTDTDWDDVAAYGRRLLTLE
mgnify:CR=1 FL=1